MHPINISTRLLLVISCLFTSSVIFAVKYDVNEIMKKVEERDQGKYSQALISMILIKGESKKERKFIMFRQVGNKESKSLMKFLEPKPMKDTGILSLSNQASDDLYWLFLSRSKTRKAKKIASGNKGDMFLGSQFAYVDLDKIYAKDFKSKLEAVEKVGEYNTWQISSQSVDGSRPYSKEIMWVDQETYVPVKVEFHKDGKPLKVLTVNSLKKIDGIWTPMDVTMKNLTNDNATRLVTERIEYKENLPETAFSLQALERVN